MLKIESDLQQVHSTRPIVVTGAHRSGTTWVGRMLAAGPKIGYINEPFNPSYQRPGVCSAQFPYWFTYISPDNEQEFLDPIAKTLKFEYDVVAALRGLRGGRDAGRMLRDWARTRWYRTRGYRPLLKDPIALLSAEWLARRFDAEVVILIRHPAAFVSSLLRVGWRHDFTHFLKQPELMRDLLAPFAAEIRNHSGHEDDDLLAHAALLWKVLYGTTIRYRERHPEWIFVRHEDLSLDPIPEFRALYRLLQIPYTSHVRDVILKYSADTNPARAAEGRVHQLKRDSRANIWNWAARLRLDEIVRIREIVGWEAEAYYGDEDWEPPSPDRPDARS